MKTQKHNPYLDELYKNLREEDTKYGSAGKKIKKARTDVGEKRAVKNLKKAWESHEDDFEEYDDFFAD